MKKNLTSSPIATGNSTVKGKAQESVCLHHSKGEESSPVAVSGESQVTPQMAKKPIGTSHAPPTQNTPAIADYAKRVYMAVLQSFMQDAINNLKTADDDINPKAAAEVYQRLVTIGGLLQKHSDLPPADMVDLLPDQDGLPIAEQLPKFGAMQALFFMEHLHHALFFPDKITCQK